MGTRWQYRVVDLGAFNAKGRMVRALAQLGADGWELVTVYDKSSNWFAQLEKGFMLFKRPVAEGEDAQGEWASVWMAPDVGPEDDPQFTSDVVW